MYMQTRDADASVASCVAFMAACHAVPSPQFASHLYQLSDLEAVRHLFCVAAFWTPWCSGNHRFSGRSRPRTWRPRLPAAPAYLAPLFERALSVAKTIRTETGISDHAVSVIYAAVELAKKIFESLTAYGHGLGGRRHRRAGGAPPSQPGVRRDVYCQPDIRRAVHLAQALQAKAIPWAHSRASGLYRYCHQLDQCPHPIIDPAMVREAMRARRSPPMFFIDIAVPRDVDPAVNTLENVFLYDIDDLHNVVQENRRERQREALAAEELVWQEVRQFEQWLAVRDAVPTIVALRQHASAIRLPQLEKALHKFGPLDKQQRRVLEALTCGIVNKLLHAPTVSLKRASQGGGRCPRCCTLGPPSFQLGCITMASTSGHVRLGTSGSPMALWQARSGILRPCGSSTRDSRRSSW